MKTITVKNRFTGAVLVSGKYESIRECLEKNRGAYLRGADLAGAYLRGADLRGADLAGADLTGAYLRGADLRGAYLAGADLAGADLAGAYLRGADLRGADLAGADLTGAYLRGAYLRGAYLRGADLAGADLGKIKEYSQNHAMFTELCRRQKTTHFTTHEWATIAIISIHRICWDTILKKHKNPAMRVFKKLAKLGWDKYESYFSDYIKDNQSD